MAKYNSPPSEAQSRAVAGDKFVPRSDMTTNTPHILLYVEANAVNPNLVRQLVALLPQIEMLSGLNGTLCIQLAGANLGASAMPPAIVEKLEAGFPWYLTTPMKIKEPVDTLK